MTPEDAREHLRNWECDTRGCYGWSVGVSCGVDVDDVIRLAGQTDNDVVVDTQESGNT